MGVVELEFEMVPATDDTDWVDVCEVDEAEAASIGLDELVTAAAAVPVRMGLVAGPTSRRFGELERERERERLWRLASRFWSNCRFDWL